tara:strand:+ start:193 stop:1476 length:1284 start_codon:yes stop_codon:yes gene_type:complete
MLIADINNPFRQFMQDCGLDVKHVPPTSRDSVFAMSDCFEWTPPADRTQPVSTEFLQRSIMAPLLYVISLDGFDSDVIFNTWQEYNSEHTLIPKYITNNPYAVVLFENGAEGHCDKYIFEFIHQVKQSYKLATVFYGNSCVNIADKFKTFNYDTFKVLYTRNYKEDIMLQLDITAEFDFNTPKKHLFNCLNNAPKPHRALLLGAFIKNSLQDNILSSPDVPFEEVTRNTMDYISKNLNSIADIKKGVSYLEALSRHYPIKFDDRDADVVHMKAVSNSSSFYANMFDCDIQLVTESMVGDCLYITEKVFKPVIQKQPFIMLGPTRMYQHLRQMGYKTYDHLFDDIQMYDTETNVIHKIDMLVNNLETLQMKKDNPSLWQDIVAQSKECAEHNYAMFQTNSSYILENIKTDMDSWLKVYTDYEKIFKER